MIDQIILAELVGWERCDEWWGTSPTWRLSAGRDDWKIANGEKQLPDPFTDANDDYAVLEHYRNLDKDSIEYLRFKDALFYGGTSMPRGQYSYKIGDHARAALKVIAENHVL